MQKLSGNGIAQLTAYMLLITGLMGGGSFENARTIPSNSAQCRKMDLLHLPNKVE